MGGYSYKKRNKAVKQSFKNRRSSPRNINIMIGGEEPEYVDDEESEMVGGDKVEDDIKAGFAAIDNYFKTTFIPKDVNKVYIEKDGSGVEVLTRATSPGAAVVNPPAAHLAVNPAAVAPPAPPATVNPAPPATVNPAPAATKPNVNTNSNIALSIANVIQKAFDVLITSGPILTSNRKSGKNRSKTTTDKLTIAVDETKKKMVYPEVISVINATLAVIPHEVDTAALNNLTTALTELTSALEKLHIATP